MKLRGHVLALLMLCALTPAAIAQSKSQATSGEQYVPRLGDIMNTVQTRHIKLWLAFKAQNWELAAYELRQFKAGLLEAAVLYEGIPVTNVTTMTVPVQAAADAAARYTASAMWIVFLSSLIALVAAAVGGWLGAGHIQRVHHLRRYDTALAPRL